MQAETHAAPCQIYFLTSDSKQLRVREQFALEEHLKRKEKTNVSRCSISAIQFHRMMIPEKCACIITQKDPRNQPLITRNLWSNWNHLFAGWLHPKQDSKVKSYKTELCFIGLFLTSADSHIRSDPCTTKFSSIIIKKNKRSIILQQM